MFKSSLLIVVTSIGRQEAMKLNHQKVGQGYLDLVYMEQDYYKGNQTPMNDPDDFYNKDDIFNLTDANETEIDDTVSKFEDEENSTAV